MVVFTVISAEAGKKGEYQLHFIAPDKPYEIKVTSTSGNTCSPNKFKIVDGKEVINCVGEKRNYERKRHKQWKPTTLTITGYDTKQTCQLAFLVKVEKYQPHTATFADRYCVYLDKIDGKNICTIVAGGYSQYYSYQIYGEGEPQKRTCWNGHFYPLRINIKQSLHPTHRMPLEPELKLPPSLQPKK